MSRIGNSPINIPPVEVSFSGESVVVKGPKGSMDLMIAGQKPIVTYV